MEIIYIRVGNVEVTSVPIRKEKLLICVLNSRLIKEKVSDKHRLCLIQIKSECVSSVLLHKLHRVGVILRGLRELLSVLGKYSSVNYAVAECGLIKESDGKNVQVVEPAADLSRVLNNKVTGEMLLEPLLVLKGIMLLRKRHASALEPAVKNLWNSLHSATTALTSKGDLINKLSVKIIKANTARVVDILNASENDLLAALVTLPYRYRSTPISVSRDIPVSCSFKPVTESSVLNGLGYPVYLLVALNKSFLYLTDVEIVCVHRLVNKRTLTSPAVRIVVFYSSVCNSLAVVVEESDDYGVHLDNSLLSLNGVEIGYLLGKSSLCVNGVDKRNTVVLTCPIVVLTERGSGMNYTNTLVSTNIVSRYDAERAVCRLVCEIGEKGLVSLADKLCSLYFLEYHGLVTEYFFEVAENVFTSNENPILDLNESIVKLLTNCKAEV